jgi:hypothetical protein
VAEAAAAVVVVGEVVLEVVAALAWAAAVVLVWVAAVCRDRRLLSADRLRSAADQAHPLGLQADRLDRLQALDLADQRLGPGRRRQD